MWLCYEVKSCKKCPWRGWIHFQSFEKTTLPLGESSEEKAILPSHSTLLVKHIQSFGHPFFPAAWPAQLCHQGSKSLLPRQVAHRLSKCLGPPLGIFTRPLWPWNDLTFGQNILWVHICKHKFFRIFSCSQRVQKLRSKIALLLEKIIFVELDGTDFSNTGNLFLTPKLNRPLFFNIQLFSTLWLN